MKDFTGFRFGNVHTKDLHLMVVSSSSRYNKNLLPDSTDYSVDVPGGNGKYYFGQTFGTREFSVNVAFEEIDEPTWRRMSQLFATDKLQELVFDENPYKTYRAKVKSKPDFKFVCFRDKETGQRIYKGDGTINFICYHPFAFGYNKYVVRAADFYKCTQPENIINKNSTKVNPYIQPKQNNFLNGVIKNHYNVKYNMKTPWKGGYPTIEQVQWGELYFNDEHENGYQINCGEETSNKTKMIIDVRDYWDNIPKWQCAAKLLTTPTLDFDQELIYAPQYSKINYYNMDIGINRRNNLIGSRFLVYNPGDIPVDFKLNLGNLSSAFRGNLDNYTFRISRYNVQRLTIDQAVDWCGMKTNNIEYNSDYKYGTRYFEIVEPPQNDQSVVSMRELKWAHPNHCYFVEPIPQEKLAHFIRLFYWQSNLLFKDKHPLDCQQGEMFAQRYEELRELCVSEEERNELYWQTLKIAILDRYKELNDKAKKDENKEFFDEKYTYEDFVYDYINNPTEYIRDNSELNYGDFIFNITKMPQYYTFDYLDITSQNFDKIPYSNCGCDKDKSSREHILPLIFDSELRMLYNEEKPKWDSNPENERNFFNYKTTKKSFNDNIKRGHWFQLPPGWSMIEVAPLIDEDIWGGKRWLDARPFYWGTRKEEFRAKFNNVYYAAAIEYLSQNCPQDFFSRYINEEEADTSSEENDTSPKEIATPSKKKESLLNVVAAEEGFGLIEDLMQFRRWIENAVNYETYGQIENKTNSLYAFGYELYQYRREKDEYGFLKLLSAYWNVQGDENSIDDWWWYANDYIWANFPPLYWGYADLLNEAQIEYIPQFY